MKKEIKEQILETEIRLLEKVIAPAVRRTMPHFPYSYAEEIKFDILLENLKRFYLENGGNLDGWRKLLQEKL